MPVLSLVLLLGNVFFDAVGAVSSGNEELGAAAGLLWPSVGGQPSGSGVCVRASVCERVDVFKRVCMLA